MRTKIAFLVAAFAVLLSAAPAATQQAEKIYRIGYLSPRPAPLANDEIFRQSLQDLGWIEGKNLAIEYRWAGGRWEDLPALAAELVGLKVDVIVTSTTRVTLAAKNATATIPIVMAVAADAVENRLIPSLARPGGNVTGMSEQYAATNLKMLEILRETMPGVTRIAFLWNPSSPTYRRTYEGARKLAPASSTFASPLRDARS